MNEVKAGIYRHFKGPLYLVLGIAHDANAETLFFADEELQFPDGRTVVVYVALQLDGAHLGPRLAVRTLEDFTELLCRTPECEGFGKTTIGLGAGKTSTHCRHCLQKQQPRFTYLGPELTEEMTT